MSSLDELLAPFLTDSPADAGPERPFGFEPFSMPVRAFPTDLAAYAAEVSDLEAMDAKPLPPQLLENPAELPTGAIDTLPLSEEGANTSTQLAALLRGLKALVAGPGTEVLWRCGLSGDVWEDLALIRAGKALVYRNFRQAGVEVFVLRIAASGRLADMTAEDGYTNLLRLTTHALTAHMAGVDQLYLPAFAAQAPGLETLRERIAQVVEHESRVHQYAAAQKGAYWPTLLASRLIQAAEALAASPQDLSAAAAATLADRKAAVAAGTRVWVGQTRFANPALTIPGPALAGSPDWV